MDSNQTDEGSTRECVICYCTGPDVSYECNRCNSTRICGTCVTRMQETGKAGKCPVCCKCSPWCDNLPVIVEDSEKARTYYNKKFGVFAWRFMLVVLGLGLSWLIGYIFSLANDGKMRENTPHPVLMSIVVYTAVGAMIIVAVIFVCFMCALCAIACLSLGIPEENI